MLHPRRASLASQSAQLHHDVFLSHSGAQKGFVKDLYAKLTSYGFHPFLDVEYHSLPLAESFPPRIFDAASSCKLGVVVLTEEYVSTKWPMLELCAFMRASDTVKILPLFFHLFPADLKEKAKLKKWYSKWKSLAKIDCSINVSEWKQALESLRPLNGISYGGAAREGEQSFIERIADSICASRTLAPRSIYDSSYMQGRDRLHQIIVDKFEMMKSAKQGFEHECLAGPSTIPSSPPGAQMGVAFVLGIYGLPGSGKSALCRSLQGYFFSQYPGRSLCLELPTRATPSNLVDVISRAFHLNTSATHMDEVISSLKNHQLWRKSIFLAVDNICDASCEVVQRILPNVIGPGSKVVLVARNLDLLRPTLAVAASLFVGHEQHICICDSMRMPSINEEEATNLLMETTSQGCGVMGPHELDLMRHKDKALTVVRMCGFHPTKYSTSSELEYLPLVVKGLGAILTRYADVDEWVRDQEKFWSSFNDQDLRIYKKDAVHMLIFESFKESLDAQQQLLFLDVAFFLQNYEVWNLDGACSILGAMHEEDAALTKKLLKDLKRLCFIDRLDEYCGITVHDVYMEFAEGIQKKGLMHWSYIRSEDIHWDAMPVKMKLEQKNMQRPVRAMTFEAKEECETVDLKNFSSLKAVVVRNCRSLVTFRMAGLTALAILDIRGFRELPRLECYDDDLYASVQNVKMLNLESDYSKRDEAMDKWQQQWGHSTALVHAYLQGMSNTINLFWMKMNNHVPGFLKQPSGWEIAKFMKGLQVLHLRETGIRNLEDMGSCSWPHLQELCVSESLLDGFRLGSLPALKKLYFWSGMRSHHWSWDHMIGECRMQKRKFLVEGKDLLTGCPALQEVIIISNLFRNVGLMKPTWRGLRELRLECVASAMEFGDLASSAHTLQHLTIGLCEKLERVHLSAGQLPSLTQLRIIGCERVVEVKFGLGALPCLRVMEIRRLSEECAVSGVEELRVLEALEVCCCSMLQACNYSNSLSGLVRLKRLTLVQSRRAWELQRDLDFKSAGFEGLSNLEQLKIEAGDLLRCRTAAPINLASLTNLVTLETDGTLLLEGLDSLPKLKEFASIGGGIGGGLLTRVDIQGLEWVRRLGGIECLTHLQILHVRGCPLLEELPSLHALQELTQVCIWDCVKLKAVEGCDAMRKLWSVVLRRCESMEQLPFKDVKALGSTHPSLWHLAFDGCGFARSRRELLLEWARVSSLLGAASLSHLLWEYKFFKGGACLLEDLEEAIVSCLLSLTLLPLAPPVLILIDVVAHQLKEDLLHYPSLRARLCTVIEYEEEPFHTSGFETHLQRFLKKQHT